MVASGWKARPYRIVSGKAAKATAARIAARRPARRRISSKVPHAAAAVAIAESSRPASSSPRPVARIRATTPNSYSGGSTRK